MCGVAVGADVQEYDQWAREILGGGVFWTRLHIHAPLYPYLLAFLYLVCGMNLCLVRAMQLGLDLVSLVLVFAAVRLICNRRVASILGFLWAVYLPLIYFSAELVSEVLIVFLFSALFLVWALSLQRQFGSSRWQYFLSAIAGLLLGLAAITHPLSMLFSAFFIVAVCWVRMRASCAQSAAFHAAVMLLTMSLAVAPVTWRNYHVSHQFVLVQAHEGLNLYLGNNSEATGTCYIRPGKDYVRLVEWPAAEGIVGENATKKFYLRQTVAFVVAKPLCWMRLLFRKLLLTWNDSEIPSGADLPELQCLTSFMRMPLLRFGMIAPLALAGVWFSCRHRQVYPLLVPILSYSLALTIFVTSGRYRLGMIPSVLVAAAVALDQIIFVAPQRCGRKKLIGLILVLLGGVVVFLPRPPRISTSMTESTRLLAEAAWRDGKRVQAEQWLRAGLVLMPQDVAMTHLLGVVLAEDGRCAAAMECYRRVLSLDPENVKARVDLAVMLSETGEKKGAEEELARALEIEPDSADVWYNLGVLAEQAGDLSAALTDYRRALTFNPGFASAHLNYGVLCHKQKRHLEALEHYSVAMRLEPRKARIATCMAVLRAETGHPQEAKRLFERALQLNPKQVPVWLTFGRFLQAQGNVDAAAQVLQEARRANPGVPIAFPHTAQQTVPGGHKVEARSGENRRGRIRSEHGSNGALD